MSLSVTRSRTFPGSRRDTIDIPKNSWPLVDAIDATSVSRPWNLPPEGGFLDGSVDGRSRKSWEGQRRRDGSRRKRTEASVVTSVAAIQEWGKSGRSGGREEWGREKAVSWSDSNRTSATLLRPRSQRLLIDHRGCQVFSIFSSLIRRFVSILLRMAVRFESDCKENYLSRASMVRVNFSISEFLFSLVHLS